MSLGDSEPLTERDRFENNFNPWQAPLAAATTKARAAKNKNQ